MADSSNAKMIRVAGGSVGSGQRRARAGAERTAGAGGGRARWLVWAGSSLT
jgi:hypothetical protein